MILLPTTTGRNKMAKSNYVKAKKHIEVTPGDSLRILREFQGLNQIALSKLTGIPQGAISAIENSRISLGVERAKIFAKALKCHPGVLVFPDWDSDQVEATHGNASLNEVKRVIDQGSLHVKRSMVAKPVKTRKP